MTFDNSLPHALPWNYPWIKDEIERRDEYIAQLEAELAHQKPQNDAHGAIDGESVKVPAEYESGAHSEPDSREKLEAEASELVADYAASGEVCDPMYNGIIELLDRQAAITEEKTRYKWVTASAEEIAAWRSKAEKLKEQVYELTAERDELTQQVDTLRNQRNAMARKLRQAENDRDRYRAALGKAIDCADEIRRLS